MDRQGRCSAALLTHLSFFLFLALALLLDSTLAYQNFTVGDDHGWTYPTTNVVDYQKWATGKNFSLGDFLLFNYQQQEHDVIVTYNQTVYKACDYLDSSDNDYEIWGEAGTTTFSAIPLVQTGMTYFFCGAYDGDHCKGGMKLAVNVTQGEGLPASLMIPPPAPADDTSPDSTPDTSFPSNDTTQTTPSDDAPSNLGFALRIESRFALLAPLMILAGGVFI